MNTLMKEIEAVQQTICNVSQNVCQIEKYLTSIPLLASPSKEEVRRNRKKRGQKRTKKKKSMAKGTAYEQDGKDDLLPTIELNVENHKDYKKEQGKRKKKSRRGSKKSKIVGVTLHTIWEETEDAEQARANHNLYSTWSEC